MVAVISALRGQAFHLSVNQGVLIELVVEVWMVETSSVPFSFRKMIPCRKCKSAFPVFSLERGRKHFPLLREVKLLRLNYTCGNLTASTEKR